jgi:hypothetical protein
MVLFAFARMLRVVLLRVVSSPPCDCRVEFIVGGGFVRALDNRARSDDM